MKALAAMAERASVADAERRAELLAEFMQMEGGCRAIALDPPSQYGRSIVFWHERSRRRYLFRTRCYCGATLA